MEEQTAHNCLVEGSSPSWTIKIMKTFDYDKFLKWAEEYRYRLSTQNAERPSHIGSIKGQYRAIHQVIDYLKTHPNKRNETQTPLE